MERKYQNAKISGSLPGLEKEPRIARWVYWYKIKNKYPYDLIADEHDLLVLVREAADLHDITVEEMAELLHILKMEVDYSHIIIGTEKARSVKNILHIHLLKQKTRQNS